MTKEKFLIQLMQDIGVWYQWAGTGNYGFDCSGLVQKHFSILGFKFPYDFTAQGLYSFIGVTAHEVMFEPRMLGDLSFYGDKNKITHIGICLDEELMVSARGGDSQVVTEEIARQRNAKVEVTKIYYRNDLFTVLRPDGLPWNENKKAEISPSPVTIKFSNL